MSRRRKAVKRPVIPDPRYNSTLVTNLVNMIMERGKRTVAQRIVYTACLLYTSPSPRDRG